MKSLDFIRILEPRHTDAAKVIFTTQKYVSSHGRAPSGRGSWVFCPADKYDGADYLNHCICIQGNRLFSDAAKIVANHFAAAGVQSVIVCP